jgi:hypothetical protein
MFPSRVDARAQYSTKRGRVLCAIGEWHPPPAGAEAQASQGVRVTGQRPVPLANGTKLARIVRSDWGPRNADKTGSCRNDKLANDFRRRSSVRRDDRPNKTQKSSSARGNCSGVPRTTRQNDSRSDPRIAVRLVPAGAVGRTCFVPAGTAGRTCFVPAGTAGLYGAADDNCRGPAVQFKVLGVAVRRRAWLSSRTVDVPGT